MDLKSVLPVWTGAHELLMAAASGMPFGWSRSDLTLASSAANSRLRSSSAKSSPCSHGARAKIGAPAGPAQSASRPRTDNPGRTDQPGQNEPEHSGDRVFARRCGGDLTAANELRLFCRQLSPPQKPKFIFGPARNVCNSLAFGAVSAVRCSWGIVRAMRNPIEAARSEASQVQSVVW